MAQQAIPVPASVANRLANSANDAADRQLENGNTHNYQSITEAAAHAKRKADNATGGEFVSIKRKHLTMLAAFAENDIDAGEVARVYLEKYGVW